MFGAGLRIYFYNWSGKAAFRRQFYKEIRMREQKKYLRRTVELRTFVWQRVCDFGAHYRYFPSVSQNRNTADAKGVRYEHTLENNQWLAYKAILC